MTWCAVFSIFCIISLLWIPFRRMISKYPRITVMGVLISWEILESILLDAISDRRYSTFIFCRFSNIRLICSASSTNTLLSVNIITFSSLLLSSICFNLQLISRSFALVPVWNANCWYMTMPARNIIQTVRQNIIISSLIPTPPAYSQFPIQLQQSVVSGDHPLSYFANG